MSSAVDFVRLLVESFQNYWGDGGVDPVVQESLEDMALCFDLKSLTTEVPRRKHANAVKFLAELIRGRASLVQFPSGPRFRYVGEGWPSADEIAEQYVRLCKRLRAKFLEPKFQDMWQEVDHYMVSPVMSMYGRSRLVSRIVHSFMPENADDIKKKVKRMLLAYTCLAEHSFKLLPKNLHTLENPCGKEVTEPSSSLKAGDTVATILKYRPGKLVCVKQVKYETSTSAIAATIAVDGHRLIGPQGPSRKHCWHAAYLLQVCRTMVSASSACERAGSMLHRLFDGESRLSPGRTALRLRLKHAGVQAVGAPVDEQMIEHLVDCLLDKDMGNKMPFLGRVQQSRRRQSKKAVSGPIVRSQQSQQSASSSGHSGKKQSTGRKNALLEMPKARVFQSKEDINARYAPKVLDPETQAAVRSAMSGPGHQVQALAPFVRAGRPNPACRLAPK